MAIEAAPYYFTYINQAPGDDAVKALESQLDGALEFFGGITEEKSLHRYAAGKWSIRETLNHVNDAERLFAFRAMWFARGFTEALPSFDQNVAATHAQADQIGWREHVDEFRRVRQASISLFRALPAEAWERSGVASGNHFSVRALAYIISGHLAHHTKILRERYL